MPKTGHRISKHQMKEDSFVTMAFRAQDYIQHHQKPLAIGLVALIVIVAGAWMWSSAGKRSELQAQTEMAAAFQDVQQKDMDAAAQVYERVISQYGGTITAREALYYLANLYFVQKKWQESTDAYQKWANQYGGADAARQAASYAAIGDAYRAQGDYDQALSYYDKALDVKKGAFLMGDICTSAVRAALMKGDSTKAVAYADKLFDAKGNTPDLLNIRELLQLHGITYTRGM